MAALLEDAFAADLDRTVLREPRLSDVSLGTDNRRQPIGAVWTFVRRRREFLCLWTFVRSFKPSGLEGAYFRAFPACSGFFRLGHLFLAGTVMSHRWWRWWDSNPHGSYLPADFKSAMSAISSHRRYPDRIQPG
jgi:hypothetical protein